MALLIGGAALLGGGSSAVLWANNRMGDYFEGNATNSTSFHISQLPENVIKSIEEDSEQQLNSPIVVYQTDQVDEKWLVEPRMASALITVLFSVSIGGFSILFAVWGAGLVILNGNSNNRSRELKEDIEKDIKGISQKMEAIQGELKEDHKKLNEKMEAIQEGFKEDRKKLNEKIDKLIENQTPTPITTSQS